MRALPLAIVSLLAGLLVAPVVGAMSVQEPPVNADVDSQLAAYYACLAAGINPSICKQILNRALAICNTIAPPWYQVCYHLA